MSHELLDEDHVHVFFWRHWVLGQIQGLNEMEHQGLSSSLIQGLAASFNKINDISNQ